MTRADRIRELYDGVRTTREIAEIVGCRPEYVRVCARQRLNGRSSESDRRYVPKACVIRKANYRRAKASGVDCRTAHSIAGSTLKLNALLRRRSRAFERA